MMDAIAPIACPSGSNNDMPSDDRSARGDFAAQFTGPIRCEERHESTAGRDRWDTHNHHEVALSR
jgi:hypothetical protein